MGQVHKLLHLWHIDPRAATSRVLDAIREAHGRKSGAAKILECKHETLLGWINKFGLSEDVDKIIEGFRKKGMLAKSSRGVRKFEVIDRKGNRIGTYATEEVAAARAAKTKGATWRLRQLTPKERAKAEDMAARARAWKAGQTPKKAHKAA